LIILIILGEEYNFSNLLSLHPSLFEIFSTPSVYVHPLMSETNFHTHTKPQAKL
jgi:hypothetical protein